MTAYVDGHAQSVHPSVFGFESAVAKEACPVLPQRCDSIRAKAG